MRTPKMPGTPKICLARSPRRFNSPLSRELLPRARSARWWNMARANHGRGAECVLVCLRKALGLCVLTTILLRSRAHNPTPWLPPPPYLQKKRQARERQVLRQQLYRRGPRGSPGRAALLCTTSTVYQVECRRPWRPRQDAVPRFRRARAAGAVDPARRRHQLSGLAIGASLGEAGLGRRGLPQLVYAGRAGCCRSALGCPGWFQ